MSKVTYNGPGDAITVDGITIEKGKSVELMNAQVVHLRQDPTVDITVEDAPETADERERIRADHDALREKSVADAAKAAKPKAAKSGGKAAS